MWKLVAAVFVVALALPALASPAGAGGLPRAYSADAFFQRTVGCVFTFIGIYPVSGMDRTSGHPAGGSLSMQFEQYDDCVGRPLLSAGPDVGVVFLSPEEFQMSPGLNKARLQTSVRLCDSISGSCFRVSIDLTYRGGGPQFECSSSVVEDTRTSFCNADVEGVVSDGTTNFTPEPGVAFFQEHRPVPCPGPSHVCG